MRFKEGDKVRIKSLDWYNENKDEYGNIDCGDYLMIFEKSQFCGKIVTISSISDVTDSYKIEEDNGRDNWTDEMIKGLVEEEEIEFTEEDKYWCDIMSESDPTTYVLPEGYQFVDENGNVIEAKKIVLEKKKKEYPKTYEECLKVLGIEGGRLMFNNSGITQYERDLYLKLNSLSKLLICRDAYWKIAGEEMGLGKPWEPDWTKYSQQKFVIGNWGNKIDLLNNSSNKNFILAFPTEEMRDAFYENFKEEMENCKELL